MRRARALPRLSLPALGLATVLAARSAAADEPLPPAAPPAPEDAASDGNPPAERLQTVEDRLGLLERVVVERQPRLTLSGFIDVGFFAVGGDGTGFVRDSGPTQARYLPQYADRFAWVFLGDLLSTPINTRGEPADLGNPPGVNRFDSIASHGAPGFIANEVNLRLKAAVTDSALATASVSFAPRSGQDFRSGDAFEVELAELEWMLGSARKTSLFVGKMDPVIGIEYRERKSDRRFGITPSLIARYTTGTPVGAKLRTKLLDDHVVIAAAVTNGSSGIEGFYFHDEIDSNAGKTGSMRLALALHAPFELELGASGEYGPQDRALDSRDALWFVGFDLRARLGPALLKAEWLHGEGTGERGRVYDDPHRPWGLQLRSGGYAEVDAELGHGLGALARIEHRDARVWLGNPEGLGGGDRLYFTKAWRLTLGARWAVSERMIWKVELLKNGEYGAVPDIRNDVFTSSLVLIF
jgi:hypothetical protein